MIKAGFCVADEKIDLKMKNNPQTEYTSKATDL